MRDAALCTHRDGRAATYAAWCTGVFVTVFTSNAVTSQLFRACVWGASNSDPCNFV